MNSQTTVEAFATIIERADGEAQQRPKAELARFQLQGLTGTLGSVSNHSLPPEISAALDLLKAYVGGLDVDLQAGAALRDKVAAYVVLADDLGLDGDHLQTLIDRWDHVGRRPTKKQSLRSTARTRNMSATMTPCTVCGKEFNRVTKHMSVAHRDEWERQRSS